MALRDHRYFLALLGLGALVRIAVQVAFPPGFVFSDGPAYLGLVDHLEPLPDRAVGYGFLLRALAWASRDVWLITGVQHLLGLVTAVLAYTLLVRLGVGRRLAALATVPVLFDSMQLVLEHSVLSDVAFDLVVLGGVAVLAWRPRPTLPATLVAGLLLGTAVCVRVVGQPLIVAAVVFCLLAGATWRRGVACALALTAAFAVPVTLYATWYHHDHGTWALSESGGRALYMRTTAFVDCSRFTVPDYERPLCPAEPVGQRLEPTEYGWHTPDGTHGLRPPPTITPGDAMGDFAEAAIRAQPGDYVRVVVRDFASNFFVPRRDFFEYDTASKWTFDRYLTFQTSDFTRPAYEAHGGQLPRVRQPWAWAVAGYGAVVYLWGPVLLSLLVLCVAGLLRRGPSWAPPTRPAIFLCLAVGAGLMLAPDATAEFVWRYQLPAVLLLPMGAALAWTRLRGAGSPQPGTVATPSTD
ncbi:MAG: hypothetical protein QOD98_1405 [Nocardioidaceae bacterium]|nr:hypothetical protein [Nocardioidaceae bacterium]